MHLILRDKRGKIFMPLFPFTLRKFNINSYVSDRTYETDNLKARGINARIAAIT